MNTQGSKLLSIAIGLTFFAASASAFGQNAPVQTSDVVRKAAAQQQAYVNEFKNLVSREVKSYEIYDKKGSIKKERKITSVFIVYQLNKSKGMAVEFRNVLDVDGKPVEEAEKRSSDFFAEVVAAQSSQKEIEKLQDETSRYDLDPVIDGLTLYQGVVLADNMQPYFAFEQAGTDTIDGRPVIVLTYQQTKASPFVLGKSSADSPGGQLAIKYDVAHSGDVSPRLRGKLWLDAETLQIRRELRQFTIQPAKFAMPAVYIEDDLEYAASDFGILTPKRIVHTQNSVRGKESTVAKNARVTFEYGKFTRPESDVKVVEDAP